MDEALSASPDPQAEERPRAFPVFLGPLAVGTAAALSAVFLWLAISYARESPPAPGLPPGLSIAPGRVSLTPDAPQWRHVKIGVVGAADQHWTDPVPARVGIDESRASKVGAPLAGRVTQVFAQLGQRVAIGAPLFSVASPELAELRAARARAGVDLEAARSTLERVQAIVASRALPAKDEAAAQQQFRQAELALQLADAKLQSLQVSPRSDHEYVVSAPRSGVVVEKNIIVDQQVATDASALVSVADLSGVWVTAELFDADATDLRPGTPASVTSPSLPGTELTGRVEMVSAVVDPARHTVPVRVRLDNPDGLLRPNVYARVRFVVGSAASVEVPATALVSDGERQYLYVQDRTGSFARREVSAGPVREGRVAVLRGLTAGESVVEEGAVLLDNQLSIAE